MQNGRFAASYIRESMGDDTEEAREGQRLDVRHLAAKDKRDPDTLIEYDDWSRSGSESARRPAQDRLLSDMRAGRVEVIYARSLDRLMRSTRKLADFLDAADATGTRIVTMREGEVRQDNPSAWMFVQTIMTAAEYESRVGRVRAAHAVATKRRLGMDIGQKPYGALPGEDLQAVIDAFKEAGSYSGAVRLLNERGVKSRRSHLKSSDGIEQSWAASTIRRILGREAPELVPVQPQRGARTVSTRFFSRLLVCPHDGSVLTTMPRKDASPAYLCRVGHRAARGDHPRPWVVAETRILPWAKEEAAKVQRLDFSYDEEARVASEDAVAQLAAKRGRWLEMYAEGDIDKAERDRRLAAIERERSKLESVRRVKTFTLQQGIDWTEPPSVVNTRLRELWSAIRLAYVPFVSVKGAHPGEQSLVPVSADWIVPPDEL